MCGIAGILNLKNDMSRSASAIHRMAGAMVNRGPDDEGYLIAAKNNNSPKIFSGSDTPYCKDSIPFYPVFPIQSSYNCDGHLFFAHRRLSIIDLSAHGHQPMSDDSGRFWIIYNGEIYNYLEIGKELEALGVRFAGDSDTEVLLYSYREWGPKALQKFNGMFAFAIWDNKKKELFCARDRIGIKPFYYTVRNNQFIFASDIKTIIASGLYKPEVNPEGLYHVMSFGVAPRPMTAFKDIYALEQAHWLRIDATGDIKKQRFWRVPVGTQETSMTENDAVELLHTSLYKSVKYRLIADVPVGTFMSGGIDSTTVSAIASKIHPGIKAFTLAFETEMDEFNELEQAKATAAMHPMDHIIRVVKPEIVFDHIMEMIGCYEEPFYSLSPNYIISQLVAENELKVILNGLGGDELFGGYGYYRWSGKFKLIQLLAPIMGFIRHVDRRYERLYDIASAKSMDRIHTAIFSIETEHSKQNLFINKDVREFNSIETLHSLYVGDDVHFMDDFEAFSYMDIMNYIGNHHVYRTDKFTMNFSIEGRVPFLDHEFIEAVYKIPSKYKVHGKIQKYILRKVAEKLIHPSCLKMEKKGFSLPLKIWMAGPLKKLISEKLNRLMERNLFNSDKIRSCYRKFQSDNSLFYQLWHLVAVELWIELFFEEKINSFNLNPKRIALLFE